MTRRLLNLLTVLSLLLCVAVCGMWLRSHWVVDLRQFERDGQRWRVVSEQGRLFADNEPQRTWEWEQAKLLVQKAAAEERQIEEQSIAEYNRALADGVSQQKAWNILVNGSEKARARANWYGLLGAPQVLTPTYRRSVHYAVPSTAAALLSAILIASTLIMVWRRKIRRRSKQCIGCGYDLTGNVSGVCPECGQSM